MRRSVQLFILLVVLFSCHAFAQNKSDLEKKKEQLQKDIQLTNQLLNQTKKSKTSSITHLITLNKKITYRTELINTISTQINGLDGQIGGINNNIESLQKRMAELKKQYGKMLYFAYKNQSAYSRLTFIFSADDFNQGYKRLKYLQLLSAYRLQQKNLIEQTEDSLSGKKQQLTGVKVEKTDLLTNQQKEKQNLDKEKVEQVEVLNNLTSKEKNLRAQLKEKQKQEQKLSAMIENIIRKEIEAARLAAKKREQATLSANANKSSPIRKPEATTSSLLASTPEALRLSNDFESNRGKLPWPVEQGFISSSFGRHSHPIWKDVVVNNNGVDINSSKGAKARAVFNGTVLRVLTVVDKYAVLVQHGEYFTLYSNLKEVYVKSGEKISTKQVIGSVQTDEDDGKTEVHLEIWKGSNKMDPENWLMAKH